MKANIPARQAARAYRRFRRSCQATILILGLASCAAPPIVPQPQPRAILPLPAPPPRAASSADWRDAPITPGIWRWGQENGASTATFADNGTDNGSDNGVVRFRLRCLAPQGEVIIEWPMPTQPEAADPRQAEIIIRTTTLSRTLPAANRATMLTAALFAHDPLLDAIAFSRGRFAVEARGMAPLYLPSWPEVARVIEDCRTGG